MLDKKRAHSHSGHVGVDREADTVAIGIVGVGAQGGAEGRRVETLVVDSPLGRKTMLSVRLRKRRKKEQGGEGGKGKRRNRSKRSNFLSMLE